MARMLKKAKRIGKEVGVGIGVPIGCLTVATLSPLIIVGLIGFGIGEDIYDIASGNSRERKRAKKRNEEEWRRLDLAKELYVNWRDETQKRLKAVFIKNPDILTNNISYRYRTALVISGSFYDPIGESTQVIKMSSGRYAFKINEGMLAEKTEDNFGRGFGLEEASERFSREIVNEVLQDDLHSLTRKVYRDVRAMFYDNEVRTRIKRRVEREEEIIKEEGAYVGNSARKRFLNSFKEKYGIDLRH